VILDFGSQYTQLIARRLREIEVFSVLLPFDAPLEQIRSLKPKGIVLSGGPSSVFEVDAPRRNVRELMEIAPLLGICYGMQLMAHELGGRVHAASEREYGLNFISWNESSVAGSMAPASRQQVWMSHGDVVDQLPQGFSALARSDSGHLAAMASDRAWAVQFHPEVTHTIGGTELLRGFAFGVCGAKAEWTAPVITDQLMQRIRAQVPADDHVLVGLSGGVDSTVVAQLVTRALGRDRVHCVFVNNGLLRLNEYQSVLKSYEGLGLNVEGVDATAEFLTALRGLTDPERKRKAVGKTFIDVFVQAIERLKAGGRVSAVHWLAQGTLYPDVIESVSPRGASVTIKSHHNVGGLPEKLHLKLLEPVRELFKDEVRALGAQLGLARELLWRHPFPGPGLSIRIPGEVTEEALEILRKADAIYIDELRAAGLYDQIWQAFVVLLPVRTVGVQGDGRTYERVAALRAVTSKDGMTADWFDFEAAFLRRVSGRITNEVRGINRVVYDITSKPPGTIEWE
jgi:GMP synthase (glutamine-hydrolysing)